MTIKEIYEAFDKIGCLTFTSVKNNIPTSRIAHLRGYDDEGIYFMTMFTKDFYKQLKENPNISLCGMYTSSTEVTHDNDGLPVFKPGYTIRLTGEVKEVSIDDLKKKNNPIFDVCIKDQQKYKAMVVFCITKAHGDIFDYDFDKVLKDHKLDRIYFSFNKDKKVISGLKIDQAKCISCSLCKKKCSFDAINNENNRYSIDSSRCDECGDCFINCPVKAISHEKETN